jgi:hypothetical protein
MSSEFLPSGRWVGFYTYHGRPRKFPMELQLEFKDETISGEGRDGIGAFVIAGVYSAENRECSWQKTYVARHGVHYRGFAEGTGIWGAWTLPEITGGFHIWPLSEGQPLTVTEEEDASTLPAAAPPAMPALAE